MNELIRECDPIEPVEQDGMLYVPKNPEAGGAFKGLICALPAAIAIWAVIGFGLWLYFKRG